MTPIQRPPGQESSDDVQEACLPQQPGCDSEATSDQLRGELETLADALRSPLPDDPYLAEPACEEAVQKARSVIRDAHPLAVSPAESASPLPIPDQIGPYRILALLGQGGMGAVYKALHPRLDKVVALKVLSSARLKTGESIGRFEREMKAVGKLDHPHLIRAFDAGEADGVHYLAMEFVDGVDLAVLIRQRGPLPTNVACELIIQAASALQAAHSRGMVHRDIKPANLMLARQEFGPPIVKVLDLGLALLSDNHGTDGGGGLTSDGQVMGTVDYMAPEQATDSHTVDIRADVYSLGATLYSLLAGGAILQDRTNLSLIQKLMVLATEPAPPIQGRRPEVSDALAAIVHKMVAKKPQDRFATPAAVANALKPFAAGADLAALQRPVGSEVSPSQPDFDDKTALLPPSELRQVPAVPDSPDGATPPVSRRGAFIGGVAVVAAGLLAAVLLLLKTPYGDLQVSIPDDLPADIRKQIQINVSGNGDAEIASEANGWKIQVREGAYQVQVTGGSDQVEIKEERVTVRRNKTAIVDVVLKKSGAQPMSPVSPPADATANAHREFATWLKSLNPPPSMEVVLPGVGGKGLDGKDPLPDGPFQVNTVFLMGEDAERLGDTLLDEFGRRLQGVRLSWLVLKSETITTDGIVRLLRRPEFLDLKSVEITGRDITDEVFEPLADCPRLGNILLHCSRETTGRGLGRLKRLESVKLFTASSLTLEGFRELEQLPRLSYLQIAGITFTSEHIDTLSRLKMQRLLTNYAGIDDAMLARLAEMPNLEALYLYGSPITDQGLLAMKKVKNLIHLDLTETKVTAAGVTDLQKALPNCKIDWAAPAAPPANSQAQ